MVANTVDMPSLLYSDNGRLVPGRYNTQTIMPWLQSSNQRTLWRSVMGLIMTPQVIHSINSLLAPRSAPAPYASLYLLLASTKLHLASNEFVDVAESFNVHRD
jgi:hypothetical protein